MSFSKTLLFTLTVAGLLTFAGIAQAQVRRGFDSHTAPHVSSATHTSTQMATGRTSGSFNNWHHHHRFNSNVVFVGAFGYPFGFGGYPYGYGYYPYDYGYYPYGYGYNSYGYGYPPYGTYYNGAAPPVYSGEAIGNGGSSVIAQVQQILARNGYYHGAIDGVIGSGTRSAIREYERAHGLAVDGRINRQLLARMGLA
ncbi:MAG: peptidoglycan-binding domain-containing protein [Verrucomicrobiota bacterium]